MARQRQQHPSRLATLSWPLLCNLFLLALAPAARAVIVVPDTPLSFGASSNNATADGPHALVKRAPPSYDTFNGRATFFQPGLGACGQYSTASDYIAAINTDQYGWTGQVSPWCFETVTVTYGGKSAQITIMDACPTCPYGGLDLSPAAFNHFASPDVGVFYMTWTAGSGQQQQSSSSSSSSIRSTSTSTKQEWTSTSSSSTWTPSTTSTPSTTEQPTTSSAPPSTSSTSSSEVESSTASSSEAESSALSSSAETSDDASSSLASLLPLNSSSDATSTASAATASTTTHVPASEHPGGNLDSLAQVVLAIGGVVGGAAKAAQS